MLAERRARGQSDRKPSVAACYWFYLRADTFTRELAILRVQFPFSIMTRYQFLKRRTAAWQALQLTRRFYPWRLRRPQLPDRRRRGVFLPDRGSRSGLTSAPKSLATCD